MPSPDEPVVDLTADGLRHELVTAVITARLAIDSLCRRLPDLPPKEVNQLLEVAARHTALLQSLIERLLGLVDTDTQATRTSSDSLE